MITVLWQMTENGYILISDPPTLQVLNEVFQVGDIIYFSGETDQVFGHNSFHGLGWFPGFRVCC